MSQPQWPFVVVPMPAVQWLKMNERDHDTLHVIRDDNGFDIAATFGKHAKLMAARIALLPNLIDALRLARPYLEEARNDDIDNFIDGVDGLLDLVKCEPAGDRPEGGATP